MTNPRLEQIREEIGSLDEKIGQLNSFSPKVIH